MRQRNKILPLLCGLLLLLGACSKKVAPPAIAPSPTTGVTAKAVLRTGENPLWFQLDVQGPRLIESIEDAVFSAALIPWTIAPHISFTLVKDDEVLMAVNGGGFLRFAPWESAVEEIGLYWFPGGDYWKPYTVAAFEFINGSPAALLYRDDRFLDSDAPLPTARVWTFGTESAIPFVLDVPALRLFPASDGWDVDVLRFSHDSHWYYRAEKKDIARPEILHFRSSSLDNEGEEISLGIFQNSAMPEHLSAAPTMLRDMLEWMDISERGAAMAVSPDFSGQRYFSVDSGGMVELLAYYRDSGIHSSVVIDTSGKGFYYSDRLNLHRPVIISLLPELPEGFVYTGVALCGQNIIATWEEQEEFSIGAAGFMVINQLEY